MLNAVFDNQLKHLGKWLVYAADQFRSLFAWTVQYNRVHTLQDHGWSWLMKRRAIISILTSLIVIVVLYPVLLFCISGPYYCALLSYFRLIQKDYGSAYRDSSSEANLKRGIHFFYFLCIGNGLLSLLVLVVVECLGTLAVAMIVSEELGLRKKLVLDYCIETKLKYLNNLASTDENWNFITYGAGLLDSEMPEENASGASVLAALIDQGVPVRRQLLRSPRHRIQKLIASLAWTSPDEGEMRWLAARIVEHVAHDLSLAHFPGTLECVCFLLDTSAYNKNNGNQETVSFIAKLRIDKQQGKQKLSLLERLIKKIWASKDWKQVVSINSAEGTNEYLILQGLRILENLAADEHNCKVICSSDSLVSKIFAPVSSKDLIQDIKTNNIWTKVTDGSLKLVSQLMRSPGETGKEMCHRVADNSRAVKNLEEVLALEINSCSIIELQIRAIEILEQLCLGESTSTNWDRERTRENLIMKVLHIFLTDPMPHEETSRQLGKSKKSSEKSQQTEQAMEENKMKEAQDKLKEKAGEALVTLCMGGQINSDYIIRSLTGCGEAVRYLTEMLDSESRTARCRYCVAVILKHLYIRCTTLDHGYLKETTLKKVLDVLHIQTEAQATGTSKLIDDITPPVPRYKQQLEERMLQVALLSLCTAIPDFASVVPLLVSPEDLAKKLKKIVEKSRYATVSCLATVKLTCQIVMALIPHDYLDINMKKEIVDSLCQASEMMSGLESCMLFAGADHDCYGLPVKPFCSDLVKQARELLREKEQEMDLPNV